MNRYLIVLLMIRLGTGYLFADTSGNKHEDTQFHGALIAEKILKMHVSLFNNPAYWFEEGSWRQTELHGCRISGGVDEVVSCYQFNMIKQVHYYQYHNMHSLDSTYFKDNADFLKRFYFYRFSGKTLIPEIDVYLFALDKETGLIFSYALPTRFEKVWGHRIPRDWVPLDTHPYIQEHFPGRKFYEFDPIGFLQDDGKIIQYEWIIKQNKRKAGDILNYIPHLDTYHQQASQNGPGYSPYKTQ